MSNITPTGPDYYTILNLPHFESDPARIRSCFENLTSTLNPHPLSSEAYNVVLKAWSVLSNPIEKAKYDEELRSILGSSTSARGRGTFWTMCPYCYCLYEFDEKFAGCCLRCQNEVCRRGFHAVAISPPLPEVVEKGEYFCPGFIPPGFGKRNGENLWVPFARSMESISKGCDVKDECSGEGLIIDISDDENVDGEEAIHGNNSGELKNGNDEKLKDDRGETNSGFMEMGKSRKKSTPWNSKKLFGRGFTIDSNQRRDGVF